MFSEEKFGEIEEEEIEVEEEEEPVDIRNVRLNYLEKFIQITKIWNNILTGLHTINELKKIRDTLEEGIEEKRVKRRRSKAE